MNRSLIKFLSEYGPLFIFLFIYYRGGKDLKIAIPPFIAATLFALAVMWLMEKKIPMIPLVGGIFITLFGGLTIYFDNPVFIYIKPTIINIIFGIALFLGKYFTDEPILKKLLGKSMPMDNEGWKILNSRWMFFFFFLALLNEIVWRTQSEEFWINFKVWGLLPITLIFTIFQIKIINKYKINE